MAEWYDQYPDEGEDLYDQMYKNLHEGKNADGSERIILETPKIKSLWQHRNGLKYEVIHLANLDTTDEEKYPVTVVYQGINGKVWTRPLKDWHRSFKQI